MWCEYNADPYSNIGYTVDRDGTATHRLGEPFVKENAVKVFHHYGVHFSSSLLI